MDRWRSCLDAVFDNGAVLTFEIKIESGSFPVASVHSFSFCGIRFDPSCCLIFAI